MAKRQGLPEFGELVICNVKKISPFAAWCTLEEYTAVEGMMHISEVAGKWVRDIRKFVKLNKQYVAKVIRIDREKNSVNLSLKRVSRSDEKNKWNVYRKGQRAEKILEQVGKELNKSLEQIYTEIGFPLQEKFGELFVAFEEIKKNPDVLQKSDFPEAWKKTLIAIIEKNLVEKEVVIKADVDLKSYANDGVERIKNLLKELDDKTKVSYISAPIYRVEVKTKNPKIEEKRLEQQLDKIIIEAKKMGIEANYRFIK